MKRSSISKTALTMIFALLSLWIAEAQPAAAHSGRVFSAFIPHPPASGLDWTTYAARGSLALPDRTGAVFVMNDAVNLYILLAIPDMAVDPREGRVLLDNNHDGIVQLKEDRLRIKLSGGFQAFEDSHRSDGPSQTITGESLDTVDGGTSDGFGNTTDSGGVAYFVFVHPLMSPDASHDIQVGCMTPRDVIGADFGADDFGGKGGFAYDISNLMDASKWDDIRIACQGDPTLQPGGNQTLQMGQNIAQLPASAFKNGLTELQAALVSKAGEVAQMISEGNFLPAVQKLANDIIPKLNPASKNCWVCGVSPDPYQAALELLAEIQAVQGVSPDPYLPLNGGAPSAASQ